MYDEFSLNYRRLLDEHQETKRKVKTMEKEMKDLRRQLAYHDNPNTPPSRKITKRRKETATPKDGPAEKSTRRRGAQPGHRGKTGKPAPTQV